MFKNWHIHWLMAKVVFVLGLLYYVWVFNHWTISLFVTVLAVKSVVHDLLIEYLTNTAVAQGSGILVLAKHLGYKINIHPDQNDDLT